MDLSPQRGVREEKVQPLELGVEQKRTSVGARRHRLDVTDIQSLRLRLVRADALGHLARLLLLLPPRRTSLSARIIFSWPLGVGIALAEQRPWRYKSRRRRCLRAVHAFNHLVVVRKPEKNRPQRSIYSDPVSDVTAYSSRCSPTRSGPELPTPPLPPPLPGGACRGAPGVSRPAPPPPPRRR